MCVVYMLGCGCVGVAQSSFHFEVRLEIVTGYQGSVLCIWMCAHVGVCVRGQNRLLHILHSSPFTGSPTTKVSNIVEIS